MNGLDWFVVGVVVLSALHAAAQGFVFELFSLVGTICAYYLAAWKYATVAQFLAPYVKNGLVASCAGFLLIFIGFMILSGVAARIAHWAAISVGLRWFDRVAGAGFGLVRGVLASVVLVMAMASFVPSAPALRSSTLSPYLLVLGRGIVYVTPGELKQRFHNGIKELDRLRQKTSRLSGGQGSRA